MTYHLINLLQCSALGLGQKEEDPHCGDHGRREPDVAVSWAPVECARVDEVRSREGDKPCSKEADRCCNTERVAAKTLGGNLASDKPRVGSDHTLMMVSASMRKRGVKITYVVCYHVQA